MVGMFFIYRADKRLFRKQTENELFEDIDHYTDVRDNPLTNSKGLGTGYLKMDEFESFKKNMNHSVVNIDKRKKKRAEQAIKLFLNKISSDKVKLKLEKEKYK